MIDTVADLLFRAGEDPASRDLHSWGTPRDPMLQQLRELVDPVIVLEEGGRGALVLDVAPEKRRAWAWGPAIDGDDRHARASALLDEALGRLPAEIERVSAYPQAGSWLEAWWRARGAQASDLVHVFRSERRDLCDPEPWVRDAAPTDLDALARLHDAAFPATYLSTSEMLEATDRRRVFVADLGQGAVGYVCAEAQPDGTGYVHYLAVDPGHRRRGLARGLLLASLRWLYAECGLQETFLTVGDRNDARRLYDQTGFALLSTGQPFDLAR